jgi:hypothetical protein
MVHHSINDTIDAAPIGKTADSTSSSADFPEKSFDDIGGSDLHPVGDWTS